MPSAKRKIAAVAPAHAIAADGDNALGALSLTLPSSRFVAAARKAATNRHARMPHVSKCAPSTDATHARKLLDRRRR